MSSTEPRVRLYTLAKFFRSVRLEVVISVPSSSIDSVKILREDLVAEVTDVAATSAAGSETVVAIQWLTQTSGSPWDDQLAITWVDGERTILNLGELAQVRLVDDSVQRLTEEFLEAVRTAPLGPILDLGGRERSGPGHVWDFGKRERVVMDMLEGDSVDVVGDAHTLASNFPPGTFAGFVSVSVFEHLLAPWQVAVQLNHVLKVGGVGLAVSHQTIGMHDQPSDFWRFSDEAWRGLFNESTGFAVDHAAMDQLQYIVPKVVTPLKLDAEFAAGYGASAVLVRKVGPCQVDWRTPPAELERGLYPK